MEKDSLKDKTNDFHLLSFPPFCPPLAACSAHPRSANVSHSATPFPPFGLSVQLSFLATDSKRPGSDPDRLPFFFLNRRQSPIFSFLGAAFSSRPPPQDLPVRPAFSLDFPPLPWGSPPNDWQLPRSLKSLIPFLRVVFLAQYGFPLEEPLPCLPSLIHQ